MLGGENMKTFTAATQEVAKAGQHAGADISVWPDVLKNLSTQLKQVKELVEVFVEEIGEKLIPYVSDATSWILKHKQVLGDLAEVLGGVMVASIAAWVAKLVWAAGTSVVQFAKMIAAGRLRAEVARVTGTIDLLECHGGTRAPALSRRAFSIGQHAVP